MKYIFTFVITFIIVNNITAQIAPPEAFNYSGVARNALGNPIVTQTIGIQLTILKTSATGTTVYKENHFTNTDAFGLFNLSVGTGAVQSGVFANINWGNDNYYLKVGLDANGGTNFVTMGTTQLLSVPYALYSKSAGSVNGSNDNDTSSTNELQTLSISGDTLKISQTNKIVLPTKFDHDTSATNEIQTLSITGDTLRISGGNKIKLPNGCFTHYVYLLFQYQFIYYFAYNFCFYLVTKMYHSLLG
jgi:hypothetical protein